MAVLCGSEHLGRKAIAEEEGPSKASFATEAHRPLQDAQNAPSERGPPAIG